MFASDFASKLKKLNPKLKIFCGNDSSKPAGLFYMHNGEYTEICGIDKNELPRFPRYDEEGHIIKSGYERILNILLTKGLTTKKSIEKVFNIHLYHCIKTPILKEKYRDITSYHPDDLREIGSKVNASN